ncbi:Cryptochrome/photolyase FAD-binding domain-containing protein [Aureobasidium subglaciale]|nr:Cryptochrome/photolyase FAD-binding domain-containing protein [Aureobasidium subglaciale]
MSKRSQPHDAHPSDHSAIYNEDLKHPTPKRAKQIDEETPFESLQTAVSEQKSDHAVRNVLHWFRSKDIRADDNRALYAASQKAKEGNGSLITMYLHSPKDLEWHGTSPARSDFLLQSLSLLQKELREKNIPMAIVTAEERADKTDRVIEFIKDNDISHVYGNYEYEIDEIRRDIKVARHIKKEKDVSFELLHDQTVLEPGLLKTGSGTPMKVFTPYHKAWLVETKDDPSHLELVSPPEANDKSAVDKFKNLFDSKLPSLQANKDFLDDEERKRIRSLWPAGHEAGISRLKQFLNDKVSDYAAHRSEPAGDPSSRLSAYFSAGVISVREALSHAKKFNDNKHFDENDAGVASWVREIVFREFYRQVLVAIPHNAMNLPQNLKFDNVHWEDDEEGWEKWCQGKTGVPWVDAGMRQLNTEAYMHNRLRMNTSSYLTANLMIDYRRGERYFATHLIDWDLSNNTQGWEPSYTVFNPIAQAEKCDKEGEYIRKWVPELKNLKGKDIFDPYGRLSKAEFEKLGYPAPHVDFSESKKRATERFKKDLAAAVV